MDGKQFRTQFLLNKLKKDFKDQKLVKCVNLSSLLFENPLIIAPHADDEIIGCGGISNHLTTLDKNVTVLIVTKEGEKSISKNLGYKPKTRISESYSAKSEIGYNDLLYFDYPELELSSDTDLQRKFESELNSVITRLKPDSIFIPNKKEHHPDHRIIGEICKNEIVSRIKTGEYKFVNNLVTYEVWGPVEMNSYFIVPENLMKLKKNALSFYKSQLSSVDYILLMDFLLEFRGAMVNKLQVALKEKADYAEAFNLYRIDK